jgi:hypothetical protein
MRTRLTNILQVIVLLTGILYSAIGAFFYYSPVRFVEMFFIDVTEDWVRLIQTDTFIAPLYFFARSFSVMIFTSGLAMILPLYDPLKYRGLIYFTGIIFPAVSFITLLYNGVKFDHWILTVFGFVFLFIFVVTLSGLAITRKEAKAGIE